MVHTNTFYLVVICFVLSTFLCEKHFQNHSPKYRLLKVILAIVFIEFMMLTTVVIVPKLFPILIYGSVMIGSYVCAYSRHKRIGRLA